MIPTTPKKNRTPRTQKKRQTRQGFFQAVLDLSFAGHAFSSLSLRHVSRQVGVVPTAFYRHFSDMDELGASLVNEELGSALLALREHLQLGKTRTHDNQISTSVKLFFESVDKSPLYWHFIVSERYGGNPVVQQALEQQIRIFVESLSDDLGVQPAFKNLSQEIRLLIADMGVNLFFSWVYNWLKFGNEQTAEKSAYLQRATEQAKVLFYGVSNWKENR
ncbi:TetR family transcriptional regulator [Faucicola boevrei]|uniref:TetR family transcriptional regulator n=1 Tax=Faucicola boevrei TaxID=346665 RepID=UPI000381053F|nr:TetR family transcriptional regulator [Moraxella boevrei]